MAEHGGFVDPVEPAPMVSLAHRLGTAAGSAVTVDVTVTNTASAPRVLSLNAIGLDPAWLPGQVRTPVLSPGQSVVTQLVLSPVTGTLPASYPFAVTVQSLDPATQRASSAPPGTTDAVLVVNPRAQLALDVTPLDARAISGRRLKVLLHNTGEVPATVQLAVQASQQMRVSVKGGDITVPPGETVRVRGYARTRRPRLVGARHRHTYTLTASGTESVRHVEGSLTQRTLIGPGLIKAVALVLVLGIWIAAALVFIPRLADRIRSGQDDTVTATTDGSRSTGDSGDGGDGGTGGGGGGGRDGSGQGGSGQDGSGQGGSGQGADKDGVQLSGTISSDRPDGVNVALVPTSLVDEESQGGVGVGVPSGEIDGTGLRVVSAFLPSTAPAALPRSAVTSDDGSWSFPAVSAPGYYLLTFSKPGYQTQKFVVDASSEAAQQPLEVDLAPGEGRLSGRITGPDGAVRGAEITITDGTNTITTSSNSKAGAGTWEVTGLSTPGSYVVQVGKDGLSTESRLVELGAGGTGRADLRLRAGVASLIGDIRAKSQRDRFEGAGGVTVTVTDGADLNRSVTTVTKGPVGHYSVAGLPVPGTYTVTMSRDGEQSQTSEVRLRAGQSRKVLDADLIASTGLVRGRVFDADTGDGVVGAGQILANAENTYKTTTTSDPRGQFRLDGVEPGTYVLSTERFGFASDHVTIKVRPGRTTDLTRRIKLLEGGVLPASSRIQGNVLDASTGLPVDCGSGPADCITATTTDLRPGDDEDSPTAFTTSIQPDEQYTLPDQDLDDGLLPGLHTVRVSAPGYESDEVDVQVPLDSVVNAPLAQLFPAPKFVGTVGAVIGSPSGPTCVWAYPGALPSSAPDLPDCQDAKDDECVASPATYSGVGDSDDPVCTYVPGSGGYSLQVPTSGTYSLYVEPSDPEYVPASGQRIVARGSTADFSASLNRLGRALVTVRKPGDSAILVASPGTTVSVDPAPSIDTPLTNSAGQTTVKGLAADSYEFSAADPADSSLTGSVTANVGLNQTASILLPLTSPISSIVGRVSVTYDNLSQAVDTAQVTITAPDGYLDTAPLFGSVDISTDGTGCFAVRSAEEPPARAPCDTVWPAGTIVDKEFVSNTGSIEISAPGYQPLRLANTKFKTDALNTFTLDPVGRPFSGSISAVGNADPVPWTQVAVQVDPAAGGTTAITVSVAADPTDPGSGVLTWNDSRQPTPNLVRPGSYDLTARLAGYAPATATLTCQVNGACSFDGPLVLRRLGSLTLRTVDASGDAVNGAVTTLRRGGTALETRTADADSVTFTGITPEDDAAYRFNVKAAGYAFGTTGESGSPVTLDCGGTPPARIDVAAGAETVCTATLTRLGSISGTLRGVLGPETATDPFRQLTGTQVTATLCDDTTSSSDSVFCTSLDTTKRFRDTTGAAGTFSITGTTATAGLEAGTWLLTAPASGFAPRATGLPAGALRGTVVAVGAGEQVSHDVNVYAQPVDFSVTVKDSTNKTIKDATVDLIQGATTLTATKTGSGTDTRFLFADVLPGRYTLRVSGDGLITSSVQVEIVPAVDEQSFVFQVGRGANTAAGKVVGDDAPGGLGGVAVTLLCAGTDPPEEGCDSAGATGTDGEVLRATTDAQGRYSLRTVPDGTFTVTFDRYGYDPVTTGEYVFDHDLAAVPAIDQTLSYVSHQVSVTVTTTSSDDVLSAAEVSLTPVGGGNTAPGPQQLTGSDGTYTTTFNQVRFGCWTVDLDLPDGHQGSVSGLTAPATDDTLACTSNLTVPGVDTGTTIEASYDVDEAGIELAVVSTPFAGHPPPTSVDLTVRDSDGAVVHHDDTFPTAAGASYGDALWFEPGHYTWTASANGVPTTFWDAQDGAFTLGSGDLTAQDSVELTESLATLDLTVDGAEAGNEATVTITPGAGQTGDLPAGGGTLTTTDGELEIDIAYGEWSFSVALPGGTAQVRTVTIDDLAETEAFDPPLPPPP